MSDKPSNNATAAFDLLTTTVQRVDSQNAELTQPRTELAATQAALKEAREALEKCDKQMDELSDAIQRDFESGVSWLNAREAYAFAANYPNIKNAIDGFLDCSIAATDTLERPADTTALNRALERAFDKGWAMAAQWSGEDHIISDMDSDAYKKERADELDGK